jgi:hypothetical protein
MRPDSELLQKISKDYSEASLFHELAEGAFSGLGLQLVNDPRKRFSMFGGCSALYELDNGLFLSVGIEPGDSNSLTMHFGRKWFLNGNFVALSNYYFIFARQFGLDVPKHYNLGYGKEMLKTFRDVIADIEKSWAKVIAGINLSVLEHAEESTFGALQIIGYLRESNPNGVVTVANFDVTSKS